MKYSIYNIEIPYKDKFIYHNTYSKGTLVLDGNILLLIKSKKDNPHEIKNIHPDLYSVLKEKKFIVDESFDEYENVKNYINSCNSADDTFHLIVNTTLDCNFKCWYCYEQHLKGSNMKSIDVGKVKSFIDKVFEDKKIKTFVLSFFGGEPLLNFDNALLPILEHSYLLTKKNNIEFIPHITTNGYLIDDRMIDYFVKYEVDGFQITLDGGREHHNKTRFSSRKEGSFDEILERVIKLAQKKFNITFRINYTQKNVHSLDDIFESLAVLNKEERAMLTLSMNRVFQDSGGDIEGLVDAFEEKAYEFGMTELPVELADYVVNSCYADKKNEVLINYNGDIYKCNARDFKKEGAEGQLLDGGKIEWNDQHKKREDARFGNVPCKSCFIFPVCGGGCSQVSLDSQGRNYCIYDFDTNKKLDFIGDVLVQSNFYQ